MSLAVNPTIFRAYDIRGIVEEDLTNSTLHTLGRAAGTWFRQQGAQTLVVGRDVRPSSPPFQAALISGLRSTGINVLDIGDVATPVMYFAVEYLGTDGGIVVSASHNPPQFNGLKLRYTHATYGSEPLSSSDIQALAELANNGPFLQGNGSLHTASVADAYVASVVARIHLHRRPRVVLDSGNGVAGPLALRTYEAVGCDVVPLFIEPDGTFPNHHPDPLKPENLHAMINAVRQHKADIGIALDGDGDRLGVVDHTGEIVWADRYLIVLAQAQLAEQPGPVVFDVKCSTVLRDAIRAFGGEPIMGQTGYPNLSHTMRTHQAVLGGELSGHTILPYPGHYFDDGAFAGLCLLHALEQLGGDHRLSLADALAPYPALPTLSEGRIPFAEDAKFAAIDHVRAYFAPHYPVIDVDGARVDFGDGWGLIRASNTEPALTTRFEAATAARVQAIRAMMMEALATFRADSQEQAP